MNSKSITIAILLITFEVYSQTDFINDTSETKTERVLSSYITAGLGRTTNYLNIGAGLFFPLGKNILIGPRANVNNEMDAFPGKVPLENIWDINMTVKYVPLVFKSFIFSIGVGAGYCRATKRGDFIRYNLIIAEHEKVYSSSVSVLGEIEADLLITDKFGINAIGYTIYEDNRTFVHYQLGIFLCKILELN